MSSASGPGGERGHLFLRYWRSARGFWTGRSARVSWPLTVGLLLVVVSQLSVQYQLNYWNRDFFNALERRDAASLWHQAYLFIPLAMLSVSLAVTSVWGRMTTQRRWRQWLTTHLLDIWLTKDRFQRLNAIEGDHQNPEYRISFDARIATDAPVDFALGLFNAVLTAVVFLDILWTVGGNYTLVVAGRALVVPAYLVVGVAAYCVIFTTGMVLIGRNLTTIIQAENQAEAEMRAAANQIREIGERAEPTALDRDESHTLWAAFRQVLYRWRQLCWQLMGTTMVSQTDMLLAPVCAWVLCAPKFLAGDMTLGELTQASAAFVAVQVAFNWFVDNYARLAEWRSSVNRVAALLLAFDKIDRIDHLHRIAADRPVLEVVEVDETLAP